jgi:hypothetical protein
MLTATYSIIALKIEQNRARWTFSSIQQFILNGVRNIKTAGSIDFDFDAMLMRLDQFEKFCHQRKMEVFVIPALRKITHEADSLLDELERLSAASMSLLRAVQEKLQQALRNGVAVIDEICASLEQCCAHFFRRLAHEDEVVQIAQRVMPTEAWFGIAESFLSVDRRALQRRAPEPDDEG